MLSVVVPVYNERESVLPLYESIRDVGDEMGGAFEIVFVDDGSADGTFEVLRSIHQVDDRVKVVRLRKNYGQTAAMAVGFRAAQGLVVVSMDGDLQNDPADVPRLLAKLEEGYDVVCGWRKKRRDKLVSRRIPSQVANWLIGRITGVPVHDNGCALRAYRADVIKRVALYAELHRFIPAMATLAGARVVEMVVRHHPRRFGRSKYGISRAWRVLLDLVLIKMLVQFASRPGAWFGLLSVPPLVAAGACSMAWLVLQTPGIVLPTVTFLSMALAGHLLVVGLLAEFVLSTGNFRPERMLAAVTIQEK